MTSVKRSALRHPALLGIGAASALALIGFNVAAFTLGEQAPFLLGGVLLADMLILAGGIFGAMRQVLVADERSEASEARLAAVVDSAMDAIITIDESQNIVLFNRAAEAAFRCTRAQAIGASLDRFIPQAFRAAHRGYVEQFGRTGVTSRRMGGVASLRALRAGGEDAGEEFPIEASISQTTEGGRRLYTVILRDITRRVQAQAESERMQRSLDATQARLAAIVDSAMDAVITVDEEQRIVLFNRAAEQVFQVRRDQAIGASLDRFLPARFRAAHRAHVEAFGRTGVTSRRMGDVTTLWALRGEEEFPIEASISQAEESGKRYYTVILRDITLRKQAEDELKRQQQELRELSARVLEAREEEKTRIARELHDELGQLLTALKMDLGWLRERLPDPQLGAKAVEMGEMLDRTVASTRRISADLRPLMLDDLGLADAAQWLIEDFAHRSGIRCEIRIAGGPAFEDLSKGLATAAYRAVQESLTNIARHAGAKSAWVRLAVEDRELQVEVEDDGRGIAPEDLAKARSLGLRGMRERVAYLGGSLEIARAPRGGTRLSIRLPL